MDLSKVSTTELLEELNRRQQSGPRCQCGKWSTYLGHYDELGFTWRCFGCKRAVHRCTC